MSRSGIRTRSVDFGHGVKIFYDRGTSELKFVKEGVELAGVSITELIATGTQASNIADADNDIAVTYTSGSAPATDGALTVADSSTPTVVELLEFCEELNAAVVAIDTKLNSIIAALEAFNIAADS